ncbi:hypothetical protein [Guyparkeria sp. TX1]|uniref:hypothetical protein n=1 Tax=Guyparkeria sp. TX1 TaxID=3115001 RepID=UPI0039776049
MKKVTLHMGLWKTGTTFLQKAVFRETGVCAGMHITPHKQEREFQSHFMHSSPLFWDTKGGREILKQLFVGKSLYTAENLYRAKIFKNNVDRGVAGVEPDAFLRHLDAIGDVLAEFGMDLQVLFFFRRQPEWLASMYSEMSRPLNAASQKDFDERIEQMVNNPYQHGDHVIKYDLLYKRLCQSVGRRRVLALPYEEFMTPDNLNRMREFTGILELGEGVDPNKRVNKKSSGERSWGLWVKEKEEFVPGKLTLSPKTEKLIQDHYRRSNQNFSKMLDLDLGQWGYF